MVASARAPLQVALSALGFTPNAVCGAVTHRPDVKVQPRHVPGLRRGIRSSRHVAHRRQVSLKQLPDESPIEIVTIGPRTLIGECWSMRDANHEHVGRVDIPRGPPRYAPS